MSSKGSKVVLAVLLFQAAAGPAEVGADSSRRQILFRSEDGQYEFRLTSRATWSAETRMTTPESWALFDKTTSDRQYEISGSFSSKTVLVVPGGRNLVMVDDYSAASWNPDLPVLEFYSDGILTNSHTLKDLLSEHQCVSSSASHFSWFIGTPVVRAASLRLTTYELSTYTFDVSTGAILSRELDSRLSGDAIYAYGRVHKLRRNLFRLEVVCPLYGMVECRSAVTFTCPRDKGRRPITNAPDPWKSHRLDDGSYHAMIIRNGECIAHEQLIVNTCACQARNEATH